MVKYFFDSYAVVELIKGNPNYARYTQEVVVLTLFNLAEIYWSALNDLGDKEADELYEHYRQSVVDVDDDVLKGAIRFRKQHKKKDLSYTDCIGYIYSVRHGLVFLTGDKEFEKMENVGFVK